MNRSEALPSPGASRRIGRADPQRVGPGASTPSARRGVFPRSALTRRVWAAAACCLTTCLLAGIGCSPGRDQVEEAAWSFVEAIKRQDAGAIERIMDWERYYSYGKDLEPGSELPESGVEKEKILLMTVLSRDRGLAITYLTASNSVEKVAVHGNEARAEILQVDRTTGDRRVVTLLLNKVDDGAWKIYRFSTETSPAKGT